MPQRTLSPSIDPGAQCVAAIAAAERAQAIPSQLLAAIAHVESGRRDPGTGAVKPWPWTINVEGQGYVFESKAAAIDSVKAFQVQGVRSIDVGCMQVNLMHHPDAFATLDVAFDPVANAQYGARFLAQLHEQLQDWPRAAAAYHSMTPELGADYQRKVLAVWPEERKRAGTDVRDNLAAAWASTMPGGAGALPDGSMSLVPPAGLNGGRLAITLPLDRAQAPRVLPLAPNAAPGRTLDAYRAAPIRLAQRAGG